MADNAVGADGGLELPEAVWNKVCEMGDPPTIARIARLCRTSQKAAYDDRIWGSHFIREFTPESCVSPASPTLSSC
jgi:hypothetical protein